MLLEQLRSEPASPAFVSLGLFSNGLCVLEKRFRQALIRSRLRKFGTIFGESSEETFANLFRDAPGRGRSSLRSRRSTGQVLDKTLDSRKWVFGHAFQSGFPFCSGFYLSSRQCLRILGNPC